MPFAVIPDCIPTCLSAAIGGREDDNVKMTPNEKMSVIMARVRACREFSTVGAFMTSIRRSGITARGWIVS